MTRVRAKKSREDTGTKEELDDMKIVSCLIQLCDGDTGLDLAPPEIRIIPRPPKRYPLVNIGTAKRALYSASPIRMDGEQPTAVILKTGLGETWTRIPSEYLHS